MNIKYIEKTTSTNDLIREQNHNLSLIWVDEQTKGRGQRGNSWESEVEKNLTFSVMTHPIFLAAENQFIISKAVSLAIVDTLLVYGINAKIKWPNDIYVNNKKICGILIECDVSGNGMLQRTVIGVGININQKIFKSEAPNPTSMVLEKSCEFSREEILEVFSRNFENLYMMIPENLITPIHNRYFDSLYRNDNNYYTFKDKDGLFEAKICSITRYGALVLRDKQSVEREYQFKEVEWI